MNLRPMQELLKLRYQLMWARARLRNGRIAHFAMGCLLLATFVPLFAAGGLNAGIIAVKSGKIEFVAQAVLGGLFVEAIFAAVLTGFGTNSVFTDVHLRRYPITAWERHTVRHVIGLADPFWLLILALETGLGTGLYVLGDCNASVVFTAILMQFISNYLLARIIGLGIERFVSRNAGFLFLVAAVLIAALLPLSVMKRFGAQAMALLPLLRWTPPFAAAACIAKHGIDAAGDYGMLLMWLAVPAAVLLRIERWQPQTHIVRNEKIPWDNIFDRMGARFGPHDGPLIAFWLRFYWRNNRLRAMYALSLPVTAFLTYEFGNGVGKVLFPPSPNDPGRMFLVALGAIFIVSFLGMSRFAMNQFGYLSGGFRRFLLLPADPAASLRAGSIASMLVGAALIPAALLLWILFGGPFDARKLIMLAGSAVTGLCIEHAAALWVTLYEPRKRNYNSAAGNEMSVMGNVVLMGSTTGALFTPHLLAKHLPSAVSPANWWGVLPIAGAAIVFYVASLSATARRFAKKREELLGVMEGRIK